jgi:hypothetical protein
MMGSASPGAKVEPPHASRSIADDTTFDVKYGVRYWD